MHTLRTRIKICGVRDVEGARAAADCGADAVGLVFVADSPRSIAPEDAYAVMASLPPFVASVGVFKDADVDEFADVEEVCPTLFSQLHGNEDVRTVRACGPDVVKAIRFDSGTIEADLVRWASVDEVCAVLIDASEPGSGTAFDWQLLRPAMELVTKPIIIAGGLRPDNVGECIRTLRPYGVDVSSGVESSRGVKDARLIEAFCRAVREADK